MAKDAKQKIHFDSKKTGNETTKYLWRNDEKSEKSVKDKIAMFSNAKHDSIQAPKFIKKPSNGKPYGQDISDSVSNENDTKEKIDLQKQTSSIKKGSLPYQSLFDVNGKSDNFKNSSPKNDKTRSTFDLTENTLSKNAGKENFQVKGEFSTLPRKSDHGKHSLDQKQYASSEGSNNLTRALSFSGESKLHSRSQSLIDVGAKNSSFLKGQDDSRRSSLAALTEHRRKGNSKLRGLVIPEKLVEAPHQVVDDLPVIKSKDCLITEKIGGRKMNGTKPETDKYYQGNGINNQKPPIDKSTSLLPSQLWKADNNCDIPKYSPAF